MPKPISKERARTVWPILELYEHLRKTNDIEGLKKLVEILDRLNDWIAKLERIGAEP